jgi:hypothetical protein
MSTTTASEGDDGGMSVEDQLREKDAKIAALESQKDMHEEQVLLLREEIGSLDIKHKEEIYWMRLEVDNLRREKEALEDRVQQVYRDLREEDPTEDPMEAPDGYDSAYVMSLQAQVGKYIRTLGILDHQIVMVKSSCDEVVKSLKEEIGDVMEEKCRMEMDLLNQLAVLDSEKRDLEILFDQQMKFKNEQVAELKKSIVAREQISESGESRELREEELLNEISELKEAKKLIEDELEAERADADDAIARLEDANTDLEQTIEALNSDLEVMREGAATAEAVEVLDALARDRQETLNGLERVAMIWEKADDSIQGLEDIMDEVRPSDDTSVKGDRERLLSTLETASLVHGQIKVSLLLVELKLRNQLNSLKNDRLRMGPGGLSPETNIGERTEEIQQEALAALDLVEESLTDQIKQLEQDKGEDARKIRDELQETTEELKELQAQHAILESEVSKLRLKEKEEKEEEEKKQNVYEEPIENGHKNEVTVSKVVLDRLQTEVLTVVERVKEKNDTIGRLKTLIEEHKVREAALKKELRRIMRRSRSEEKEGTNGKSRRSSTVKTKT